MPDLDIKAFIFDVFGTVVDWRGSVIREGQLLGEQKGIDIDWAAFADAWRAKYQPAMEEVRTGRRPFVVLDVLHHENLLANLAEFGIDNLSEDEINDFNKAWHRLTPWPDTVEGLTRLKSKYIIATQSNGNIALMIDMAKNAGMPWDMILGSEVVGHYKPQPEAYINACKCLDLRPDQVVMTAAHNGDLQAAAKCGLRTAFVARPLEHGPNQKSDIKAEADYTFVAESFTDLADQVGC